MNIKKVQSLFDQIEAADKILLVTEGVTITSTSYDDPCNSPENEIIRFGWEDENEFEFRLIITEEGLNSAIINKNNELVIADSEGEEFIIKLFEMKQLSIKENW